MTPGNSWQRLFRNKDLSGVPARAALPETRHGDDERHATGQTQSTNDTAVGDTTANWDSGGNGGRARRRQQVDDSTAGQVRGTTTNGD